MKTKMKKILSIKQKQNNVLQVALDLKLQRLQNYDVFFHGNFLEYLEKINEEYEIILSQLNEVSLKIDASIHSLSSRI